MNVGVINEVNYFICENYLKIFLFCDSLKVCIILSEVLNFIVYC